MSDNKKKLGRKRLLTKELMADIVNALGNGVTVSDACLYVGIGESTFYRWLDVANCYVEGEDHPDMPRLIADREILREFLDATTRARAAGRIRAATHLQRFIRNPDNDLDPRLQLDAIKFYLERTDPDNWGRQRADVKHDGQIKISISYEDD